VTRPEPALDRRIHAALRRASDGAVGGWGYPVHNYGVIAGFATPAGTARYADRLADRTTKDHFRDLRGASASTVGLGTYLGPEDEATDARYRDAVVWALERGANVIDTAINYRHQRSERAIGESMASLVRAGTLRRDEVVVATKGGFVPFDTRVPPDPAGYFLETYVRTGVVEAREVVAGCHCMTPRYLTDQLDRSRTNLGLETLDVYYIHNPEIQLQEVERVEFMNRIRAAFAALEEAVAAGKIRYYGTATWSGYRQSAAARDYLSLAELVRAARDVGGDRHHFQVIQVPYNLAMTEAFTRANQDVHNETVSALTAAERLGLYVMASASVHQGQLARNLPPMIAELLPGLTTDAQRALQFVRSTPGIGTALVGMKMLAHLDENLGVAALPPVPWAEFQRFFQAA
jgi:aryl-alcohol dehydrogenase-like predicted oxidoreductase